MSAKNLIVFGVAALVLCASGRAEAAATFVINNLDGPGVGFNDPTVVAPVGGNPGTTVGDQRLAAFEYAANTLWGSRITSSLTIYIDANFGPLACTATSGTLGSAGPTYAVSFPTTTGTVPANTSVSGAEAEKLGGINYNGGTLGDISASFNGSIGTTGCLESKSWYYGFDKSPGAGQIDFVTVLLHELAHGLGFLTFVDNSTGAEFGGNDDIYEVYLSDFTMTPSDWKSMSDGQRMASAINTNDVVWTGSNVTAAYPAGGGQDGSNRKLVYTPPTLAAGSSVSHWTQSAAGGSSCASCAAALSPIDLMRPSYTVPIHETTLTHDALEDMGWGPVGVPIELGSFTIE